MKNDILDQIKELPKPSGSPSVTLYSPDGISSNSFSGSNITGEISIISGSNCASTSSSITSSSTSISGSVTYSASIADISVTSTASWAETTALALAEISTSNQNRIIMNNTKFINGRQGLVAIIPKTILHPHPSIHIDNEILRKGFTTINQEENSINITFTQCQQYTALISTLLPTGTPNTTNLPINFCLQMPQTLKITPLTIPFNVIITSFNGTTYFSGTNLNCININIYQGLHNCNQQISGCPVITVNLPLPNGCKSRC